MQQHPRLSIHKSQYEVADDMSVSQQGTNEHFHTDSNKDALITQTVPLCSQNITTIELPKLLAYKNKL